MLKQSEKTSRAVARAGIAVGVLVALAWIVPTVLAQDPSGGASPADAYREAQAHFRPVQGLMQIYLRVAGIVWIVAEWTAAIVLIRAYKLIATEFLMEKGEPK